MGAVPVFLAQSFSTSTTEVWPTQAQMLDWNCAIREALPSQALISWYVWRQENLYPDSLAEYPAYWPSTVAGAC